MADKRINRTVNIDGELYGPGYEDEMLEHLQSKDDEVEGHDSQKELTRMEKLGHIEGFVDLDDDEREEGRDGTSDEKANRAGRQAVVQERAPSSKKGRTARKSAAPKPDADDDDGDDED